MDNTANNAPKMLGRKYILLCGILIAALLIALFTVRAMNSGFSYQGQRFTVETRTEDILTMKDSSGNILTLTDTQQGEALVSRLEYMGQTVELKDGTPVPKAAEPLVQKVLKIKDHHIKTIDYVIVLIISLLAAFVGSACWLYPEEMWRVRRHIRDNNIKAPPSAISTSIGMGYFFMAAAVLLPFGLLL